MCGSTSKLLSLACTQFVGNQDRALSQGRKIGFEINSWIQTKAGVLNMGSQKGMLLHHQFQCSQKCILFHTEIIFRSRSKDFAVVHYTFFRTNITHSVSESLPRWVFLIISGKLLVRTRSPKILIFRSRIGRLSQDYIISRFVGSAWHFFFFDCNKSAQLARTPGTHIDGGAVTRKPGNAWLEGTPAIDLGHMNVVLKCMYVGSVFGMWNFVLK